MVTGGSEANSLPEAAESRESANQRGATESSTVGLLRGLIVIALTPFTETGEVDEASLRRLMDFYLDAGVHGVALLGIMGEASKLTEADRDKVIRTAIAQVNGRVPIVVGCSAPGTHQAVAFAKAAASAGADAIMVAPPNGIRNLDLVLQHYQAIADACPLPLVVQDEPTTTGVVLPPSFFARVVDAVPTAKYAKIEEAPTIMKVSQIRDACSVVSGGSEPRQLGLFGGLGGMYLYEELSRGAIGVMTGFAFPEILADVCNRFASGDEIGAREVFYRYLPLIRYEAQLGVTGVGIRKEVFRLRGVIASSLARPPAPAVDARTLAELQDLIRFLGL